MFETIKWPEEMAPSRSPIHFTNELKVAASPETIWLLLVKPKAWPRFYRGVEHVQRTHEKLLASLAEVATECGISRRGQTAVR